MGKLSLTYDGYFPLVWWERWGTSLSLGYGVKVTRVCGYGGLPSLSGMVSRGMVEWVSIDVGDFSYRPLMGEVSSPLGYGCDV